MSAVLPQFARLCVIAAALWLSPAHARDNSALTDCMSDNNSRRIQGCTALLEDRELSNRDRSLAHAMRALAFSLQGKYELALTDYSRAISLNPGSSVALNNRAWVRFRIGEFETGLEDVEQALAIDPSSPHALDTRAHINASLGKPSAALADYETAMRFGGERIVKLYQCGLQAQGLYAGAIHGIYSPETRTAMRNCVYRNGCDPLPPDEDCRNAMS